MRPKIVVIGSLHTDLTIKVKTIPRTGETVLGKDFKMSPGGMSNQRGCNICKLWGALAITKIGAQEALPTKEELESFMKRKD